MCNVNCKIVEEGVTTASNGNILLTFDMAYPEGPLGTAEPVRRRMWMASVKKEVKPGFEFVLNLAKYRERERLYRPDPDTIVKLVYLEPVA